jgi:hypothetical protein
MRYRFSVFGAIGSAPGAHIDSADDEAKRVGWHQAQLCGSKTDDAHNDAIGSS